MGPKLIEQLVECESHIQTYSIGSNTVDVEPVQHVFEKSYDIDVVEFATDYVSTNYIYARSNEEMYALKYDEAFVHTMLTNRPEEVTMFEKKEPQWICAGDLEMNDYLAVPVPTYTKDVEHITENDCYLFGAMIANPYMKHLMKIESGKRLVSEMIYTIHVRPFQYAKVDAIFKQREIKTFHSYNEEKDIHIFQWSRSSMQFPFRYSDFYDATDDYRIGYRILNLPAEKCKQIVKGFLDTCGTIDKDIRFNFVCDQSWIQDNKFYQTLYYLCLRSGFFLDVECKPLGTGIPGHFTCIVDITPTVCQLMDIVYDGRALPYFEYKIGDQTILFTQIKDKDYYEFFGTMYDPSLAMNSNYLTSNGLFRCETK